MAALLLVLWRHCYYDHKCKKSFFTFF